MVHSVGTRQCGRGQRPDRSNRMASGQGEVAPRFVDGARTAGPLSDVMTPAPPTSTRAPEIRALTGARGIPVLLILFYAYGGDSGQDSG